MLARGARPALRAAGARDDAQVDLGLTEARRVPGDDAYAESFDPVAYGLKRPARFDEYRGFWFMCLDEAVASLTDYLGRAKDYIDLVIDQSPSGQMEIIAGVQEYDVAANWKLMVENSVDDYHLPSTHSTWLNFMANSGVKIDPPPKESGQILPTRGKERRTLR